MVSTCLATHANPSGLCKSVLVGSWCLKYYARMRTLIVRDLNLGTAPDAEAHARHLHELTGITIAASTLLRTFSTCARSQSRRTLDHLLFGFCYVQMSLS